MKKNDFLKKMNYPIEWDIYKMYPDELYLLQVNHYCEGDEQGSEHDRNGAFHWWLNRNPSNYELLILIKLSYLDPDQIMAEDVRSYIRKSKNYDINMG